MLTLQTLPDFHSEESIISGIKEDSRLQGVKERDIVTCTANAIRKNHLGSKNHKVGKRQVERAE